MKGVGYMGMDFNVNVNVKTNGAEKIDVLEKQINSLKTQGINLKVNIDSSSINTSNLGKQLQDSYRTAGTNVGKAYSTALQTQINTMARTQRNAFSQPLENITKQQQSYINWWEKSLSKQQKTFNQLDGVTASNKTLTWLKNNSKAAKDYGEALQELASKQKTATNADELKNYTKQVNAIKTEAAALGKTGRSFVDEISRGFKKIGQFTLTYGIIQRIAYNVPRQLANSVLEVDTAMTELRKVSDDFEDGKINQYFDHATESAKKYGAAINEVINSTADWKRLGYSIDDASKLSDATTLLQRVGDNMTQESSSQGLISILKGYNLQAGQVNQVIDVINQVANTEPIDTSGIVSALQRSASSLSAAGNDLNQSVSMITAANSVVQDPDTVGTAFRTLSMRIRGAKTELEDANLDTEGMAESTAKLREEIKALSGVDIMIDNDTFKSTYDILGALADKWSELTDIQQASITELIAGKRQGNIMSALMTNWDIVEDTMKQASNADGSAEKELSNYQQSLQYSLDKMKATAQEFANVTLDSSWLKAGVDGAQTLLNLLTQIEKYAGIIPLIFGGAATVKAIKNFDKSNDFVLYGCESIVA